MLFWYPDGCKLPKLLGSRIFCTRSHSESRINSGDLRLRHLAPRTLNPYGKALTVSMGSLGGEGGSSGVYDPVISHGPGLRDPRA